MFAFSLSATASFGARSRRAPASAGLLFLATSCLAGCGSDQTLEDVAAGRAEVTGQGVLVIAVDGLRWDHTSLSGYDRDTTPYLASLAKEGIVFTDAWSPTPSLVGSHVAILSGSDPQLARPPVDLVGTGALVSDAPDPWFIPDGLWLLGRSFLGRGWNTAAFVDDPQIAELNGFSVGFRDFVEFGGDPLTQERSYGVFGVGRRFVEWSNRRPLDENWFAYLQMHDLERVWTAAGDLSKTPRVKELTAHWTPRKSLDFAVPLGVSEPLFHVLPPSRASELRGVTMAEYELRYDRGIRALDANIARVVDYADQFGRADNLTVVIVGSFGMQLGENGFYLQAGLVEEEDLRVPLLIRPSAAIRKELGWAQRGSKKGKKGRARGRVSDALVSLIDLAPTLADLLDLPTSGRMLGISQRRALMGAPDGSGQKMRQRLFTCSAIAPGTSVVEGSGLMTFYRPSEASTALRNSWGLSAQAESSGGGAQGAIETYRSRVGESPSGIGLPSAEVIDSLKANFRHAGRSWEQLVLRERRALHFGGSDSDRPGVGEFHLLQEGSAHD